MMVAGKDYGVRIVRAYQQFSVGAVIFPTGVLRQRLVQGGFAVPEEPAASSQPAAAREPSGNRLKRRGEQLA